METPTPTCKHCIDELSLSDSGRMMVLFVKRMYEELPPQYMSRCIRDIPIRVMREAMKECVLSGMNKDSATDVLKNLKHFKTNGCTVQYFKMTEHKRSSGPRELEWWDEARKNEW